MNRWIVIFVPFLLAIGTLICILTQPQDNPTLPPPTKSAKTILLYTSYFKSREWELGALGKAPFSECPVSSDCWVTDDPAELPSVADFDAVLFHLEVRLTIKSS